MPPEQMFLQHPLFGSLDDNERRDLLKHLRGPVTVVWDRGNNHKGPLMREFLKTDTSFRNQDFYQKRNAISVAPGGFLVKRDS